MGAFAPLETSGVSRLYWCNSPRLLAPSTWGQLDRAPLTAQFPPFADGEITVRGSEVAVQGGVEPTSQTTAATNADNGVSWARQSALWTQRRPAARVARTRTRDSVR